MTVYRAYVRGHGGAENIPFPPSEISTVSVVTLGDFGCTMSDQVADYIINGPYNKTSLQQWIDGDWLIYWTKEQRDTYYDKGTLAYSKPALSTTLAENCHQNLALQGAKDIGGICGVCYYNAPKGVTEWIVKLGDGEEMLLSDIITMLNKMASDSDQVELYWTACMAANYWSGTNKKVSFNPKKNFPH